MKRGTKNNFGLILLLLVVVAFSLYYYQRDISFYLFADTSEYSAIRLQFKWWIMAHFGFAAFTLFVGPLQFVPQIRKNYPKFHRLAGRLYIIGSIVSAITVYVLLATTYELPGAIPSLGLLAAIWLFTTVAAYRFIRKRNVLRHKEFMLRSYVCGLAFVFIRLLPGVHELTGLFSFIEDSEMRRTVYEWICWVYPLILVEFWLVWRKQLLQA
ncbi:DUF2306 domain-containing protein [Ulvibacterium marinum]|uniref:DUF2306 domain-containing protein n=1 Tax=Ulvibacterium marinum TaxID=2419782 RepID=A0A3B0CAG7_9FLAO|nr:DUF2306 domain-containing protein [Ulvibacterium marinum]RKN79816.1 DUF2306 domain-containing protein [Ulvibacterium marinum]